MRHMIDNVGDDLNATASDANDCNPLSCQICACVVVGGVAQFSFEALETLDVRPIPSTGKKSQDLIHAKVN